MNRQELVAKMAEKAKIEPKVAEKALAAFMNVTKDALADGEAVQLIGFGSFEVRKRAAREARNLQTGATIHVPARTVPVFRPGKAFKDAVNG